MNFEFARNEETLILQKAYTILGILMTSWKPLMKASVGVFVLGSSLIAVGYFAKKKPLQEGLIAGGIALGLASLEMDRRVILKLEREAFSKLDQINAELQPHK